MIFENLSLVVGQYIPLCIFLITYSGTCRSLFLFLSKQVFKLASKTTATWFTSRLEKIGFRYVLYTFVASNTTSLPAARFSLILLSAFPNTSEPSPIIFSDPYRSFRIWSELTMTQLSCSETYFLAYVLFPLPGIHKKYYSLEIHGFNRGRKTVDC